MAISSESASGIESFRALLLDKAFRPLRAIGWRRAVCLDLGERVEVLEYYERHVRTATASFPIPAVIRVPGWLHRLPQIVPPTRRNVLLRDGYACQYCGWEGTSAQLTIDHVLPRSRGGRTSWTNAVTACAPCNRKKGDRTPVEAGMPLGRDPREPAGLQLGRRGMVLGQAPAEWEPYL